MTEAFAEMVSQFREFSPVQLAVIGLVVLLAWFIPTFLGLIRNGRHIGKIFLLNIPAGFTFTSWFLLMGLVLIKFDNFSDMKDRFLKKRRKETVPAANE